MDKTYFLQQDADRGVISNTPFKEKGVAAHKATVTQTAMSNYYDGTSDFYLDNGTLKEKASNRKANADALAAAEAAEKTTKENRRKELLNKVTDGRATTAEKDEFLTLI